MSRRKGLKIQQRYYQKNYIILTIYTFERNCYMDSFKRFLYGWKYSASARTSFIFDDDGKLSFNSDKSLLFSAGKRLFVGEAFARQKTFFDDNFTFTKFQYFNGRRCMNARPNRNKQFSWSILA